MYHFGRIIPTQNDLLYLAMKIWAKMLTISCRVKREDICCSLTYVENTASSGIKWPFLYQRRIIRLGRTWAKKVSSSDYPRLSIKTGAKRIMRPDELTLVVRLGRRTTEGSSTRPIIRFAPVFIVGRG